MVLNTAQKMRFEQIRSFLRIWSHLLKKFLMEKLIFCAVESLGCYQAGWDFTNVSCICNFLLHFRTFLFRKRMSVFYCNIWTCFSSVWMLEFWVINKFIGKISTNRQVSKSQHNAKYLISLVNEFRSEVQEKIKRNTTARMLVTAFVTLNAGNIARRKCRSHKKSCKFCVTHATFSLREFLFFTFSPNVRDFLWIFFAKHCLAYNN